MAITAEDLIQPTGELEPAWFPADDEAAFEERLGAYIAEGAEASAEAEDTDAATRAFAYWRAYEAVYLRLSGSPASVGIVGHLNRQYTQAQVQAFRDKAAQWRSVFDGYVAGASESAGGPVSRQTAIGFTY